MKRLLAITDIHRCIEPGTPADKMRDIDAVPPKIEVIKSGKKFMPLNQTEYDDLIRLKGAVDAPADVSDEHVSEAPAPKKAPAAPAPKKDAGTGKKAAAAAAAESGDGGKTTMNAPVGGGMSNSGVTTNGGDGTDLV